MAEEQQQAFLADALIKSDAVSREDLDRARARQEQTGVPLYRTLLQMGKLSFETLDQTLRYEFYSKAKRSEDESLGRMLVAMKAISEEQLQQALKEQNRTGKLLGDILMSRGAVSQKAISVALAKQYAMEYAELAETPSERDALDAVPESLAFKHQMIPVRLEGDRLSVLV